MPHGRPFFAVLILATIISAFATETSSQPSASSPEGIRLLHKLQDALGGAKRIAAVKDFEETIRAEARDSNSASLGEVRKRTRWMRSPNVVRLDQIGPRGTYVLYFDGSSGDGWEILPDLTSPDIYKTAGKAVSLAGGELEFAKGYLFGFDLNVWLADQMPGFTVSSPKPNIVRIDREGKATDFTLDPVTSLPLTSASLSLADPNHPVQAEMRYDGWKEVSGVRFSTHRVNYHNGVNRGEVTTETIRVNSGLRAQDLATKPADFSPDLPRLSK